ncbi:MAG: carboxypeptidase regulatory-like domain-containing protein [Fibrobacteria bacterium]|nr:carboxypeptidase regulatory-like domain-containing protein [Fibrobacteria bacterium]
MKIFTAVIFAILIISTNAATISGTVTDSETGNGLDGARMTLVTNFGATDSLITTTSNGGQFKFTDVLPQFYILSARFAGYNGPRVTLLILNDNEETTRNMELTSTSSTPGVDTGAIAGTVQDTSGEGIEGATVILAKRSGMNMEPLDTLTTDQDGKYSFSDVATTSIYAIFVSAENYNEVSNSFVRFSSSATEVVDFTLEAYQPPAGAIAGKVTDEDSDEPIQGARVKLLISSPTTFPFEYEEFRVVSTDAEGNYIIPALKPSDFETFYYITVGEDTTLTGVAENDTTTVNLTVKTSEVTKLLQSGIENPKAAFLTTSGHTPVLHVTTQTSSRLTLFNSQGKVLFKTQLTSGAQVIPLNTNLHSVLYLQLENEAGTTRQILMPRH